MKKLSDRLDILEEQNFEYSRHHEQFMELKEHLMPSLRKELDNMR